MPQPWTYRHASREYSSILETFKSETDLVSDNMAYTAIEAVLHSYRARLKPNEVMVFADILPCVLRAIFIYGWKPLESPLPFPEESEWYAELKEHRPNHNLTPQNAKDALAIAFWQHINHRQFELALEKLSKPAADFWRVNVDAYKLKNKIL